MPLPLPRVVADVEAGGPIVTALRGINQLQSQEQQNYYNPLAQLADIASKTTYAQYLPAQISGQLLSNPLVWTTLPKEQLAALSSRFGNLMTNPPNVLANLQKQLGNSGGGLLGNMGNQSVGGGIINWLKNLVSPHSQSQQTPSAANAIQSNANVNPFSSPMNSAQNNALNAPSVGNALNTPENRLTSGLTLGGSMGGLNPLSASEAQSAGLKAGTTAGAASEVAQRTQQTEVANQQAQNATKSLGNLEQLHAAFKAATAKGPIVGTWSPALKKAYKFLHGEGSDLSPEQALDNYSTNLVSNIVNNLQRSGHITDNDFAIASQMKINSKMEDAAEQHVYEGLKETTLRDRAYQSFINSITQENPNITAQERNTLWNSFNSQYPVFETDQNGDPILDKNGLVKITKSNRDKWKLFTTPKALQFIRQNPNGVYTPEGQKNETRVHRVTLDSNGNLVPIGAQ